jgi:type VI secretion system protein ImpH
MAGANRTATHTVEQEKLLERVARKSHPFQVMRRLENLFSDYPRFGTSPLPSEDPVRLRQTPYMGFAPSFISSFKGRQGDQPPVLSVYGFGLFGANGPLPLHLTEYTRYRMREGDATFKRFADIFHHRLLALFYRAWANAQPTVQFDRPGEDRFALYVGALGGLALPTPGERKTLPDDVRRHYVGHLACQTRHPEGLESILSDYFEVPVRIDEFVGHWVELPPTCRCRLGESPETGSLGQTLAVGSRIWQCQDKFRIVFGPLAEEDYQRLLPGSESVDRLVELVRTYVGDELSWDVRLILSRQDVRGLRLGGRAQLGLTSWLLARAPDHDPGDLVFQPRRDAA